MKISRNQRKTPSCEISIGDYFFLISYDTVVAARGNGNCARRTNHWGPTTGRHMKDHGVYNWPENDELVAHIVAEAEAKLS